MFLEKKANLMDVAYAVLTVFVIAIALFVTSFMYDKVVTKATNTTGINQSEGATKALKDTRDLVNSRYDWVVFGIFVGFVLAIIITGWLVGGNPMFIFIYFIGLIILIVIATIFSFTW